MSLVVIVFGFVIEIEIVIVIEIDQTIMRVRDLTMCARARVSGARTIVVQYCTWLEQSLSRLQQQWELRGRQGLGRR